MNCLVTGTAGFIGSHLAERLLKEGHTVRGVDCFTDYYPRSYKESNLKNAIKSPDFTFIEQDLRTCDLKSLTKDINVIYHQSAQAGVRASWGNSFTTYTENNIWVTQRLLESVKGNPLKKFIYASSSSIYGDVPGNDTISETQRPQPISPYGVSKLAAEHLCYLYWKNYGVPTVSLRYFTVYGPRQRPDMAFHKFIRSILENKPITVYGDGTQKRDFTYIADIIDGNISAMEEGKPGEVYNLGGGHVEILNDVLNLLSKLINREIDIQYTDKQYGDVNRTSADIQKAKKELSFNPKFNISQGLTNEIDWVRSITK